MSYIVLTVSVAVGALIMRIYLGWRRKEKELLYQRAKARRDQIINDRVDRWHALQPDVPLHVYLGLTSDQYEQWMRDPDSIDLDHIWSGDGSK